MYQRYALFYTPAQGSFETAGRDWLGWCSRVGREVCARGTYVERAAKYGFHGTLVAPFVPTMGANVPATVRALARKLAPAQISGLALSQQHGFFALRPEGDDRALRDLAAACVRALHPLRQMPDADELARRRRARLSPRQEANLMRWGYPYVMEDFGFHMTLTARVKRDAQAVEAALLAQFDEVPLAPFTLEALTLMGERADGRFVQIERVLLTGASAAISSSE